MKQPNTPIVPPEKRAGTYEDDEDVTGLLWYGTHTILTLPRDRERSTMGTASDRDLVVPAEGVSARHCVLERRARGLFVTNDASRNGLAYEVNRDFGLALKPGFEDKRDAGEGFVLVPGMTFVLGAEPYRFIAFDDAMRKHHGMLLEILGTEDEVQNLAEVCETPSPSDLILAASGPGHLLITGKPGCEQHELVDIIHKTSKRRRQPFVKLDRVPDDRQEQSALLKRRALKGTLVVDLGTERSRLDPTFVSSMFSPGYQIRVIVIARTSSQARSALGHQHWRPLMHIELCPMSYRRAAIYRLLDEWLASLGSVLRVSDLTPQNRRMLLLNPWRENLAALRQTAVRLDAIVRAEFSRKKAAADLGVARQTFYDWCNGTMRLTKPLVAEPRKHALLAALAHRSETTRQ
jgi:hypothetical protein